MPDPVKKTVEVKPEVEKVVEQPEVKVEDKKIEKEIKKEIKPEAKQSEEKLQQAVEQAKPGIAMGQDDQEEPAAPVKDELTQEVESVLEEDLDEMFENLPPEKQQEFKEKGEETAGMIKLMIGSTKVKSRKIVHWIKDWLKMIPGINKFFLEQEAKIKTDKLLVLADEEKEKHQEEM
jgi:hypothetical protein